MWSIGAFLELDDRAKLEEFIRKQEDIRLDLPVIPSDSDSTMFDYYVDNQGDVNVRIVTNLLATVELAMSSDPIVTQENWSFF